MRITIAIILIAFLSSIAEFFLPWWAIMPVAFCVAWAMQIRARYAFFVGFLGIVLFWLPNMFFTDWANDHILSSRMAVLFLHKPNYFLFMAICALVGGVTGGFGALSGALLRKAN